MVSSELVGIITSLFAGIVIRCFKTTDSLTRQRWSKFQATTLNAQSYMFNRMPTLIECISAIDLLQHDTLFRGTLQSSDTQGPGSDVNSDISHPPMPRWWGEHDEARLVRERLEAEYLEKDRRDASQLQALLDRIQDRRSHHIIVLDFN